MNFTVNVEIDWLAENDLDNEFRERVLDEIATKILKEFEAETGRIIATNASALIRAKTELLINTILEKPVVVSDGWQSKEEYESIYDMVEVKMTKLYKGKLDTTGKCEKDPLLKNIEQYIKNETDKLLITIQKKIEKTAASAAKKAVNDNELIKAIGMVVK